MASTYSTAGLDLEQRRVLAALPESVRADWAHLCQNADRVCQVSSDGDRWRWLVLGGPHDGASAPSPLELIEVTR